MSKSWTVTSWLTTSAIGRLAKKDVSQSSSTDGTRTMAGELEASLFDFWLNCPDVSRSISSPAVPDRFGVERAAHNRHKNNWNIRDVKLPPAHSYIAIFELVRPFDHRMTPGSVESCSGAPETIIAGPYHNLIQYAPR